MASASVRLVCGANGVLRCHVFVDSEVQYACADTLELHGLLAGLGAGGCSSSVAFDVLLNVKSATSLCVLRRVIQSVDHAPLQLPWCNGPSDSARLLGFLERRLFDMLCDASTLSPEDRFKKWSASNGDVGESLLQMPRVQAECRIEVRRLNKVAYKRLTRSKGGGDVVQRPLEWLAARPPTFWHQLSLEGMSCKERAAVLHRMRLLTAVHGRLATTDAFREMCEYEFDKQVARRVEFVMSRRNWFSALAGWKSVATRQWCKGRPPWPCRIKSWAGSLLPTSCSKRRASPGIATWKTKARQR